MEPNPLKRACLVLAAAWIALSGPAWAQDSRPTDSAPASRHAGTKGLRQSLWTEWKIDGVTRQAWIHLPWKGTDKSPPVVFAFHGHGGSAQSAAQMFRLHDVWPEALVVYMEGLPTRGRLSDPEGKRRGWQNDSGDQDDRDLKFFDAALATLKGEYKIDEDRVYATGHSNGGSFTYLLWATRPDVFAAFAPSAAGSRQVMRLVPKPSMHVAGEKDDVVRFSGQVRTMKLVRAINGCTESPQEWAKGCLLYPSSIGAPFVSFIHPGDHRYPVEAPALIVKFLKDQVRQKPSPESRKAGG